MKIKSIQLHPFAGIKGTFEFKDGLNLIIGSNEAGKSTIFNALKAGLLTSTNLTAAVVKDKMGKYFPKGGDVIRVTIVVADSESGDEFVIQKEWEPGNRQGNASLIKPDGTEITNEDSVQSEIENIMPVTPSTLREVMMSKQSDLHRTMEKLSDSPVKQELGDVLRQQVMEAGGMSVDRFQSVLSSKYDDYFDNWDREKKYPKTDSKGLDKGVNNPHKKKVGFVLKAWYRKEEMKIKLQDILTYEEGLDRLNKEVGQIADDLREKKRILDEYGPLREQLRDREVLENKRITLSQSLDKVKKISATWPVHEHELDRISGELTKINAKLQALDDEQEKASKKSELARLKGKMEKINQLKGQITEAEKDLKGAKEVTEEDISALRELDKKIGQLKSKAEASKLTVSLHAKEDVEFVISDASGADETLTLKKGDNYEQIRSGFLSLESESFELKVTAGAGEIEQILNELIVLEEENNSRLKKIEAKDLADAVSSKQLYDNYKRIVDRLTDQYKAELGDENPEEIKGQLSAAGDLNEVRDLGEVQRERDDVRDKKLIHENKQENIEKELSKWIEEYGDMEGVFKQRSKFTSEIESVEEQLSEMPGVPEEFESFKGFSEYVGELTREVEVLKDQKSEYDRELARMEERAPDISAEEYSESVKEAEQEFERVHRKAESLARVYEKTEEIICQVENETYEPLKKSYLELLSVMSDGRFKEIGQEKTLPESFTLNNGWELEFDLLSHGTKDLAALAWKLAATEYFLNGQKCFIILDDPMVDMDPDRRRLAGKAIEKFAGGHQALVFTCHPYYKEVMVCNNIMEI